MPPSGSTFTDWQQDDSERRLLVDEDFSWSEPPARTRRGTRQERSSSRERATDRTSRESARDGRSRTAVLERDPWADHALERTDDEFEAARARWSDAYPETPSRVEQADALERPAGLDRDDVAGYGDPRLIEDRSDAFDLSDPGRRTVIITGRGDARYMPAPRRRRSSELRFHERSGFNPDRAALWAVLLGVALLLGCIAH
jgi:hypothetical protein